MLGSCPPIAARTMTQVPRLERSDGTSASPAGSLAGQHDELDGLAHPPVLGTVTTLHRGAAGPLPVGHRLNCRLRRRAHWNTGCAQTMTGSARKWSRCGVALRTASTLAPEYAGDMTSET